MATPFFDFPAKSGQRRVQSIRDPEVKATIEAMRRRRGGPDDLLVFREDGAWRDVRSEDVNAYLKTIELPNPAGEATVTPRRQGLVEHPVLELIT